jgi:hypothetical protein
MRPSLLRHFGIALVLGTGMTACASISWVGPGVRRVSRAERNSDCALIAAVSGTEPNAENESALAEVRRKVLALGGNAMFLLSTTVYGDARTVMAEALNCRFGAGPDRTIGLPTPPRERPPEAQLLR